MNWVLTADCSHQDGKSISLELGLRLVHCGEDGLCLFGDGVVGLDGESLSVGRDGSMNGWNRIKKAEYSWIYRVLFDGNF